MKRFIMALVISVLLASLFLGSCGEPGEETPEEGKYGGILRMITPMDPTVLGYPAESAGRATYYQYAILERLIIYAPDVWQNQNYQGILATSYTFENDMKTWTFQLREGVTFHDGTPWNAEAAKWNFDLRKEAGNSTTFNSMISADVLDDYTIQLNFESPANTFEVELATGVYFISPTSFENAGATQEERIDWARGHPVGTGPFKFVEAVLGDHVTYERYDDYWAGKPYLEGVEFIIVPDATTSKNMMIAGEADAYIYSEFKETLELEAMDGFYARYCGHHTPEGIWPSALEEDSYMYIKEVREAIEYAIDREAIISAISLGSDTVEIMYQAPIPGDPAYRPDFGRHYDLDKAKELMASVGLENGFETTIYVRSITGRWADMALFIQSMLAEINITVNIEMINPGQYMTYLLFGWPADTLLISGIPNEPISNFVAARDYACTPEGVPKWNYSTVQTPEMCALWAELKAATSPEATREAYVKLSHQAMDDAVGIYMMDWPDTAVFADYITDCDWIAYSTKVWNANTTWMAEH